MVNPWVKDRARPFYLAVGVFGLLVVAFGFGVTYAAPMFRRTFTAPWFVHVHGASALSWILLLIAQSTLVRMRKSSLHRSLGRAALPLAFLVWASGIATAVWASERDFAALGTIATSSLAGTVSGLSLYLLIVGWALVIRRRPDWHKRLMLLATIQVLWPAFFRLRHWLPMVPDPDIWFALVFPYSLIVLAALRDLWRWRKIHPVWLFVGPALIIEQCLEVAFFNEGIQRQFGEWLFALVT
ncbi:MAG: hypothetical protein HKN60_08725 [Rhizobiales bacterium]|nr:hypothetical protein [Hyphomicrobiales bacterium]